MPPPDSPASSTLFAAMSADAAEGTAMRFARLNVGMFRMRGALFVKSAPPFHELNSRAVGWWWVTKNSTSSVAACVVQVA